MSFYSAYALASSVLLSEDVLECLRVDFYISIDVDLDYHKIYLLFCRVSPKALQVRMAFGAFQSVYTLACPLSGAFGSLPSSFSMEILMVLLH